MLVITRRVGTSVPLTGGRHLVVIAIESGTVTVADGINEHPLPVGERLALPGGELHIIDVLSHPPRARLGFRPDSMVALAHDEDPKAVGGRRLGIALGGALVALVLVALIAQHRPAYIFGVSETALDHSLLRAVGGETMFAKPCTIRAGAYRCDATSGSGSEEYEIRAERSGCWQGRRLGDGRGDERRFPASASGCIRGWDYLRPMTRL